MQRALGTSWRSLFLVVGLVLLFALVLTKASDEDSNAAAEAIAHAGVTDGDNGAAKAEEGLGNG